MECRQLTVFDRNILRCPWDFAKEILVSKAIEGGALVNN